MFALSIMNRMRRNLQNLTQESADAILKNGLLRIESKVIFMIRNILEYLEKTAERLPDKIAFSAPEGNITFAELRDTAKHIGTYLTRFGKSPVAVMTQKTPVSVAAFLGCVYSGNFYTPIDVTMPKERVLSILNTLQPKVLLIDEKSRDIAAFDVQLSEAKALAGEYAQTIRKQNQIIAKQEEAIAAEIAAEEARKAAEEAAKKAAEEAAAATENAENSAGTEKGSETTENTVTDVADNSETSEEKPSTATPFTDKAERRESPARDLPAHSFSRQRYQSSRQRDNRHPSGSPRRSGGDSLLSPRRESRPMPPSKAPPA